jgi:hypothetical protein
VKRHLDDIREDGWAIQYCQSVSSKLTGECEQLGEDLLYWLNDANDSPYLLAVNLLMNVPDELRVLYGGSGEQVEELECVNSSESNVWDELTTACTSRFSSRGRQTPTVAQTIALSFSNGKPINLYEHPNYGLMHGLWDAASNFKTTSLAVPIFSSSVLSTMRDVSVPASAYSSSMYTYDEIEDIP